MNNTGIDITSRGQLFALIEASTEYGAQPSKYGTHIFAVLQRDGKTYMLEYDQHYSEGVDVDTAEIYEVVPREVTTIVYDRVPSDNKMSTPVAPPKSKV